MLLFGDIIKPKLAFQPKGGLWKCMSLICCESFNQTNYAASVLLVPFYAANSRGGSLNGQELCQLITFGRLCFPSLQLHCGVLLCFPGVELFYEKLF